MAVQLVQWAIQPRGGGRPLARSVPSLGFLGNGAAGSAALGAALVLAGCSVLPVGPQLELTMLVGSALGDTCQAWA